MKDVPIPDEMIGMDTIISSFARKFKGKTIKEIKDEINLSETKKIKYGFICGGVKISMNFEL